jgi:hypothetical protein
MNVLATTYDLVRQPERHAKTALDLVVLLAAALAVIAFFTGTRPSDVIHQSLVAVGANGVARYFGADGPPLVTFVSNEFQTVAAGILGLIFISMFLFVLIGGQPSQQNLKTRGIRLALMPWPALAWLTFFLYMQLGAILTPKDEIFERALLITLASFGAVVGLTAALYLLGAVSRFLLPARHLIEPIWTIVLHVVAALLFVGQSLVYAVLWIPLQIWNAINSDQLERP